MNESLRKKLIIMVTYLSIAMLGVYITLYQYTILSVTQLFQLNTAIMGLMIAMQHIGISIPPLFLGTLCYKIGKKKLILIAFACLTLGTFTAGITQSFLAFIISIFIIGTGFSIAEATLSAVLTDEFPEESTKHLNFSQVAFSVGALCGPFIAAALIKSGIFFKDLYIYNSIIFLFLGILFTFTKYGNDKGTHVAASGSFNVIKFLRKRVFLLLAISIFLYVGIENTVANYADSYCELALNAPQLSAVALALFWGAMIPSRLLAGIIKVEKRKVFLFLSALIFFAVIGAMLIPNNTIKIIMFAICGFGCGPIWPAILDTVAKKNTGSTGPAFNVMMAFSGLGGATLPIIAGIIVNYSNQVAAYYMCAVASVFMLFIYLSSLKKA